jgi:hypothetical protein
VVLVVDGNLRDLLGVTQAFLRDLLVHEENGNHDQLLLQRYLLLQLMQPQPVLEQLEFLQLRQLPLLHLLFLDLT